ncbi:hypothetical protein INH39_18095 [Massilia violaceinigra]|uniref:Glycosyl hydrolase n=1 Tax=Massilia violaceinigra TaxID=2045208 RepID=A0ABY3ZZA4_9BURK|nr:hypothetical protein [Massilia violaceinigra]UOD27442.1 hypothetical protein INH39_18095 [Massilia violaceinigra]
MRTAPDGSGPAYPPEFEFSPLDGAPLQAARSSEAVWIAPSGARSVNDPSAQLAVGLQQSAQSIDSALLKSGEPDGEPPLEMPLPPPGAYEFFSAPFGTRASVLIAIDTSKGAVFAWLPAAQAWQPLVGEDALLSECHLSHRAWRAELMVQFNSCLFLATDNGLVLLQPDFAALQYRVAYFGDGAAQAAPIAFEKRVWVPVTDRSGMLKMVNVDTEGEEGPPLLLGHVHDIGEVSRPVAYGRTAVWPCGKGQICLQTGPDGAVSASFIPWQQDIMPHFEFGSPYLSRAGVLWQLCFSGTEDTYVYVRLGTTRWERVPALTPRLCSGTVNYRFSTMYPGVDPWLEPEHGDDGAANAVVFPLLELSGSVLALKMASTSSLTALLNSHDKMRAELIFEDRSSAFVIQTIPVPQPWDMRVFVHQGALWAYHPGMQRIIGWGVAA